MILMAYCALEVVLNKLGNYKYQFMDETHLQVRRAHGNADVVDHVEIGLSLSMTLVFAGHEVLMFSIVERENRESVAACPGHGGSPETTG